MIGLHRRPVTTSRRLGASAALAVLLLASTTGCQARAKVFAGTAAWVDIYDWSPTWVTSRNPAARPPFTAARIDRMAEAGIQQLYIQTASPRLNDLVLDRALLRSLIARARSHGMTVMAWFTPTFADPGADIARMQAAVDLGVDGLGVDIEVTTAVTDVATRNQRVVDEVTWMRAANPDLPIAAIVLEPVLLDVINTRYWPEFPWTGLAGQVDAWMPMGYWTNRTLASGYRDGYRYTAENIDRLRAHVGDPNAPVHVVGGLSNTTTDADINGFVRAATERGALGGSLYDDMISSTAQYGLLAPLAHG